MLTDEQIDAAKQRTTYSLPDPVHQHNDCIRIAYEWLDAQKKLKRPSSRPVASKHLIENWGGRYVSASDVCVAAELHPDVEGTYPYLNISSRLIEPSTRRLEGIAEANTHYYRSSHEPEKYNGGAE